MVNKSNKWVRFTVSGLGHYIFHNAPCNPDTTYNKPAMYKAELELTEDSTLNIEGDPKEYTGIKDIKAALKTIFVTTSNKSGTTKDGEEWERNNVLKFQSKVIEPEDVLKRKPRVVDSVGDPWPEGGPLIGNGSWVTVKGALPDYRINPPKAGYKPLLPTFESVQVIDLVEYIKVASSTDFTPVEGGYTIGSRPTKTVVAEVKAEEPAQEDDSNLEADLALLERVEDLEPKVVTPKVNNVVKRKAR